MTLRCGGNASQAIPGVGANVVFSAALITEGLGAISPYLLPLAALVDSFVYQALSACTTDPPAMPTAAQLNPLNAIGGVLNPNFQSWLTAVNNLLLNWAWDQFCQCVTGSPTALVYPVPPTNVVLPVQSVVTPCSTLTWQGVGTTIAQQSAPGPRPQINTQTFPPLGTITRTIGAQTAVCSILPSPAPASVTLSFQYVSGAQATEADTLNWIVFDVNGNQLANAALSTLAPPSTQPNVGTVAMPAGAHDVFMFVDQAGTVGASSEIDLVTVQLNCTAPGNCAGCTGDPGLQQSLNTIIATLNAIYASLQPVVRNYSESTVHSGLSGNGTITLGPSAIAIRVNITADTTGGRIDVGSPSYYFDRGYIVEIALEGPIRKPVRLTYTPQLFVLQSVTEQIGYTLPVGVTISITELTRSP